MKKIWASILVSVMCVAMVQAGFGIQVGAYSPTSGLEDNDNSLLFGVHFQTKFTVFGFKAEAFYVDSSGNYADVLGEEFGRAEIDVEAIISANLQYYPIGTTFFLQGGLNYTSIDASGLDDVDFDDVVDNELGLEVGAGITLLDKLLIQGKVLYTPDAIQSSASDTLRDLDENLMGFQVSVGWQF